jgi:hypothetical protein
MKIVALVFLVILAANEQSAQKAAPHKAAPDPPQMSHDFRTAGRRAVATIGDLGRVCASVAPACGVGELIELGGKAEKAIKEADAQHDNAVDKQAVELLKEYYFATFDAAMDQSPPKRAQCEAGACQAMYATCKTEAEEAFESGLLPTESACNSLSPRNSK